MVFSPLFKSKPSRTTPASRARKHRPELESLEGRQLLSVGPEFLVNTTTRNAQFDSDTARAANGRSVVVWTDTFSSTDHDIRAQRYNAAGFRQGPEIVVAGSSRDDDSPSVAMDPQGNFVVAWRQTQPGGDTNVLAQRFNAAGVPIGSTVQVGVGTFKEHDPDVAIDAFGRFTVAYVRDTNNNNPDVFAKRYDSQNNLLNVFNVGTSSRAETHPSIAMTPDGRFDVAYQFQFSSSDDDVLLARFSSGGSLLGTTLVAGSSAREQAPSVAMDNFGNAVVAYQKFVGSDFDIKARRVSPLGSLGAEINIQSTTAQETAPAVALKQGGGGFVVAYNSASSVKVTEVSAFDTVLATIDAGSSRFGPAISIDGNNNYLLTDTSSEFRFFPFSIDQNIRARFGHLS
jgi:hypothetical protein